MSFKGSEDLAMMVVGTEESGFLAMEERSGPTGLEEM
jgi:hypothetical protein